MLTQHPICDHLGGKKMARFFEYSTQYGLLSLKFIMIPKLLFAFTKHKKLDRLWIELNRVGWLGTRNWPTINDRPVHFDQIQYLRKGSKNDLWPIFEEIRSSAKCSTHAALNARRGFFAFGEKKILLYLSNLAATRVPPTPTATENIFQNKKKLFSTFFSSFKRPYVLGSRFDFTLRCEFCLG